MNCLDQSRPNPLLSAAARARSLALRTLRLRPPYAGMSAVPADVPADVPAATPSQYLYRSWG